MAESKQAKPLRPSEASDALKKKLKEDGKLVQKLVADDVVHRTLLWKYARGQVKPGIEHAIYLERATGVPVASWAKPPKSPRKRAA